MIRDVLGDKATDDLLVELQTFIQDLKVLGWKEIRPWDEFFATFKPPAKWDAKNLEERVTTNFLHYRSNYLIIASGILVLKILFAPFMLFSTLIIAAFAAYLLYIYKKPIVIGEFVFAGVAKFYFTLVVSFILLLLSGTIERMLWVVIYSIFFCGLHMIFRPRSINSKSNKLYEEMKLNGFDIFSFAQGKEYKSNSEEKKRDLEDPNDSESTTNDNNYTDLRRRGYHK